MKEKIEVLTEEQREQVNKSHVSRSVYQKLAEENKKLIQDISVLVLDKYFLTSDRINVLMKWRYKFEQDKQLVDMLREMAIEHFKKK